jgi:hypothetical protein
MPPPSVLVGLCPTTSKLPANDIGWVVVFSQLGCVLILAILPNSVLARVGGGALVLKEDKWHVCVKFLPLPHGVLPLKTALFASVGIMSKTSVVLPWGCVPHVVGFPEAAPARVLIQGEDELHWHILAPPGI